jgi:hypothetical protein
MLVVVEVVEIIEVVLLAVAEALVVVVLEHIQMELLGQPILVVAAVDVDTVELVTQVALVALE